MGSCFLIAFAVWVLIWSAFYWCLSEKFFWWGLEWIEGLMISWDFSKKTWNQFPFVCWWISSAIFPWLEIFSRFSELPLLKRNCRKFKFWVCAYFCLVESLVNDYNYSNNMLIVLICSVSCVCELIMHCCHQFLALCDADIPGSIGGLIT